MRLAVVALVLLLCWGAGWLQLSAAEGVAGSSVHPAEQQLRAQRDAAEAQLAQLRQEVEAQRQEHYQQLQETADAVQAQRQQRQELAAEVAALRRDLEQQGAKQSAAAELRQRLLRQWRSAGLVEMAAGSDDDQALFAQLRRGVEQRLEDLRAGTRVQQRSATVFDRRGEEVQLPVLEWGQAQRVALGEGADQRGFLTRGGDGSWLISGPHLGSAPSGLLWLDVSGRLAADPPLPRGLQAYIQRGGPFVWPIFAIALVALVAALGRLLLRLSWRRAPGATQELMRQSDPSAALSRARAWRGPVSTVLAGILSAPPHQRQELAGAALAEAEVSIGRSLRLLAVLAAAAPLLGLLGTVTGMIASFQALGAEAGADAERLSAGIGQALLTTELGLMVAVPILIIHALFARDASRLRSRCESEALHLLAALDELHPPSRPVAGRQADGAADGAADHAAPAGGSP